VVHTDVTKTKKEEYVCIWYLALNVQGNAIHYLEEVDTLDDVEIDDDVDTELV